jgi:hypothetical protein
MQRSKILKGLALLSSVFLVTLFLLYRSGKLGEPFMKGDGNFQNHHNSEVFSAIFTDTVPDAKDSTIPRLMMPSSKSMVLTEPKTSDRKKKRDSAKLKKKNLLMGSSKSGRIFVTEEETRVRRDSTKADSSGKKNLP